ncbi:hypothetical protein B0H14DRAFT_2563871 [Mycena olivaceomarginata]|nr:hypothetical protein B0H14DRAFT_2563871 [Mycena olivaceomarginata]
MELHDGRAEPAVFSSLLVRLGLLSAVPPLSGLQLASLTLATKFRRNIRDAGRQGCRQAMRQLKAQPEQLHNIKIWYASRPDVCEMGYDEDADVKRAVNAAADEQPAGLESRKWRVDAEVIEGEDEGGEGEGCAGNTTWVQLVLGWAGNPAIPRVMLNRSGDRLKPTMPSAETLGN